jgi:hypothetical protein
LLSGKSSPRQSIVASQAHRRQGLASRPQALWPALPRMDLARVHQEVVMFPGVLRPDASGEEPVLFNGN